MSQQTTNAEHISAAAIEIAVRADMNVFADNWVGALQDAAIVHQVEIPVYEVERQPSPDHEPIYRSVCKLLEISAEATGSGKQDAKQNAARAWIDKCHQ